MCLFIQELFSTKKKPERHLILENEPEAESGQKICESGPHAVLLHNADVW